MAEKRNTVRIMGIFGGIFLILALITLVATKKIQALTAVIIVGSVFIAIGLYIFIVSLAKSRKQKGKEEEVTQEMSFYIEIAKKLFREQGIEPINLRGESAYVGTTSTAIAVVYAYDYWKDQERHVCIINKKNIHDTSILPPNMSDHLLNEKIERQAEKPQTHIVEDSEVSSALTGITEKKRRSIPKEVVEEKEKEKEAQQNLES